MGNRRTALASGEMVTRILVPESSTAGTSSFLKLGARKYLVISISMVAARLVVSRDGRIEEVAIAVGACSEVAQRMKEAEAALRGARLDDDWRSLLRSEHFEVLAPIDDVRATANYRNTATLELVQRAVANAMPEASS